MVPINFHQYRIELRQVLLARWESLASEWDPFSAAWICYALSTEGIKNNHMLAGLCYRMLRWMEEEDNLWETQRYLGPIAATLHFCQKIEQKKKLEIATKLSEKVQQLNADDKWSLLRDPEQVYLLALGLQVGDEAGWEHLKGITRKEMQRGPLQRRILYAAALRVLGESVTLPPGEPQDAGDIIALVWWTERYGGDKHGSWDRFSSVKDRIALDVDTGSDTHRILRVAEIAMLYEAVTRETVYPDPILIFEHFPFHQRVRDLAEKHFVNKNYLGAVFEAAKALNELIQQKSGIEVLSEVRLVNKTMLGSDLDYGKPDFSKVIIQFNDYLRGLSGQNEQEGLGLMCKGVFKAFRNPKGHKPEDHPVVQLDAYEALEQLIIISFLMRRIERASTTGKEGAP